jgi:hypothetical protein
MFQTKLVVKIKTHILCSTTFPENRTVCEIMWGKMVQEDRPQMTIWRMRIACWMTGWGVNITTPQSSAQIHNKGSNTSTRAEYFVFQFAIQKYKYQDIQKYNFACCFVWV